MIVTLPCAIIIIRRTNNNWALLRDKWPISPLRVGYLSVTGGLISCEDWSFRPKYTLTDQRFFIDICVFHENLPPVLDFLNLF